MWQSDDFTRRPRREAAKTEAGLCLSLGFLSSENIFLFEEMQLHSVDGSDRSRTSCSGDTERFLTWAAALQHGSIDLWTIKRCSLWFIQPLAGDPLAATLLHPPGEASAQRWLLFQAERMNLNKHVCLYSITVITWEFRAAWRQSGVKLGLLLLLQSAMQFSTNQGSVLRDDAVTGCSARRAAVLTLCGHFISCNTIVAAP